MCSTYQQTDKHDDIIFKWWIIKIILLVIITFNSNFVLSCTRVGEKVNLH